MKFISTKKNTPPTSLKKAIEFGLAPDGGLFIPDKMPQLDIQNFLNSKAEPDFLEIAIFVLTAFLKEEYSAEEINKIAKKAFTFPILLNKLDTHTHCLELFHGPTAAFKDVAAQFISSIMDFTFSNPKTILVATSGDTGGAIASAFNGHPLFNVVILFPKNGVSPLQLQQLTCWNSNVKSLAVDGSFDDCQRLVKTILANKDWVSQFNFTSANSINIARLLPQACYYAASSIWYKRQQIQDAQYIIPTGNMGNCVAAFWAREMGFPIKKIIMATNSNHVVETYFKTGMFKPLPSVTTLANAMDVGHPSNFERLTDLIPNLENLKSIANAESVDDDKIRATIKNIYLKYKTIICPHTATAFYLREQNKDQNFICVATADPAKFSEVIQPILPTVEIPIPQSLQNLYERPSHFSTIKPSAELVINSLLK